MCQIEQYKYGNFSPLCTIQYFLFSYNLSIFFGNVIPIRSKRKYFSFNNIGTSYRLQDANSEQER